MSASTRDVAERFMAALQGFEAGGSVEGLAGLFAADAELANLTHAERGAAGARRFWEQYRSAFGSVRSHFAAVVVGDGAAALEWESAGALASGAPVRYRGVSLLEVESGRVRRFRTYYDSAALLTAGTA